MKEVKPIKLRNRLSLNEVYYTLPHWQSKEIDGVMFTPVVKNPPSNVNQHQQIHFMRKDSLERMK